ncbi:hypothetical protein KC365_g8524, partial [Hortaea werneckii]
MIHVKFHKGQQQTGRFKENVRFLAHPIGELLLDYMVQCLEDASARASVPRLHVANWRQMTVAIVKTKFASHINAFEANEDDEDPEEIDKDVRAITKQRNHKTRTVNRAYANQIGTSFGNVLDGLVRMALLVCILPTGAGKSLLFMLPCTLPDAGTTVLVVPLIELRGDLMRRMRKLRIEHIEWQPGERRDAPLVIVSVEAAGSKDFCKYARMLISQQKLDRIVVDKCHLTVTAVEYRPSMVDLTAIRVLRTQFVYLTATLPPAMQAEFEERNHLLRPRTIRAPSNRSNLFYM